MKILLVVKSKVMENLGVMHLSSVAKHAGNECKITDINDALLVAVVWRPQIIGFSIMTGDREKFRLLAQEIQEDWPDMDDPAIVVGGPDVTFFPEGYEWANVIISGEAENPFAELLGSPHRYPNIDSIPWPDRTDFPDMKIRDFIASRGCAWKCRYCSQDRWSALHPELPRVRHRRVDDVVAECAEVGGKFNYFQDSAFGLNLKWLNEFSPKYAKTVRAPFHVHARPSQITDEYAGLLSHAGCYSLRFALETASTDLRKLIGRGMTTNEEALNASESCRKYGIKFMVQNILSLPKSTIEDDLATLEMNIRCRPHYAWASIFSPFPGTDLGDQCVEEGWFNGDYNAISDSFFDKSVLNFSDEYKEQSYYLQKCFALAVEVQEMPNVEELTSERFPLLVHRLTRKQGDSRLYRGIL
jgi:anaerobic magnesium-protoporphyrin IX monomethyl ester cyclase